jgi:hypothetical protein
VSHNDLNTIERRVAILRELRRNALESIAFVERLMAASQWTVGTPPDMSDDLNDDLLAG